MTSVYSFNLAKCADINIRKLYGMKSHDSPVFMENLISIMSNSLLNHVLNPLTKSVDFFNNFCNSTLRVDELVKLDKNIIIILYQLEQFLF